MATPSTILVEGFTLADAWQKLVKEVMKNGTVLPTEYGPKSKDLCALTVVRHPYSDPTLHPSFPTRELHLAEYIKQFDRNYDWRKQGFTYTYMDRFTHYPVDNPFAQDKIEEFDQLALLKNQLTDSFGRRNQIITWVPVVDDMNDEPPCLQRIWMRRLNDTDVEMHCDWRSRDLFTAWNSNYIAILTMIKREILDPLNLKLVKLVDFCDSLHIYDTDWEEASKIKTVAVCPMMMR